MWWRIIIGIMVIVVAGVLIPRQSNFRKLFMAIPHFAGLVKGLFSDTRVPTRYRVALGALIAYLASPLDLIPDFIPLLGYLDDVIVIAVAFDAVINQLEPVIVRAHWHGDQQILAGLGRLSANVAAVVPATLRKKVFGSKPSQT